MTQIELQMLGKGLAAEAYKQGLNLKGLANAFAMLAKYFHALAKQEDDAKAEEQQEKGGGQ
jgi:hypothetical protein